MKRDPLLLNKKGFLSDYIEAEGVGLYVCGAYQLLGNYYEMENKEKLNGLSILNFYTKNEGVKNRSVGNIKSLLNKNFKDELFKDKKVVLFSVPGAFTPTCKILSIKGSAQHVPGFLKMAL